MTERQFERYLLKQDNDSLLKIRTEIDRIINSRNDEFFKMHLKTEHQRYVIQQTQIQGGQAFQTCHEVCDALRYFNEPARHRQDAELRACNGHAQH
jgi:hypothetical protein